VPDAVDPDQLDFEAFRLACNAWLKARQRAERLVAPLGPKSSASAYEKRIVSHHEIETRSNLHDAMNGLMWLSYPLAKRSISALHVNEIAAQTDTSRRGPRRDAITLLDEHGVIMLSHRPDLMALLRGHHWQDAWCTQRQAFIEATRVVVFGHALLARLFTPHKSLGAHALVIECGDDWPDAAALDQEIARRVQALSAPGDLLALPAMGLPGWADAQDEAFYADQHVFRPAPLRDPAIRRRP
jgi:hypothetical protein